MALTRRGTVGWFFATPGELQTDRFGLSIADAVWKRQDVGADVNPGSPVVFGQSHPTWSFLTCDKVAIRFDDHGWSCSANFFGVTGEPAPVFDLDFSTAEQPIETHPDFATLAGVPGLEYNGARFDTTDGAFVNFTSERYPEFRGVKNFLLPGAVWRMNYVTATRPTDLGQLGSVDYPEGNPPQTSHGRNWLYTGMTWEQRGLTYAVKKEWRLSGKLGWNRLIYR